MCAIFFLLFSWLNCQHSKKTLVCVCLPTRYVLFLTFWGWFPVYLGEMNCKLGGKKLPVYRLSRLVFFYPAACEKALHLHSCWFLSPCPQFISAKLKCEVSSSRCNNSLIDLTLPLKLIFVSIWTWEVVPFGNFSIHLIDKLGNWGKEWTTGEREGQYAEVSAVSQLWRRHSF